MKNAKQYADKFKAFIEKAGKGKSFEAEKFLNNTDCAVKAMLYEFITETKAGDCIAVMREHFVDWNDLRVSRLEEVLDVFSQAGITSEEGKPIYASISRMLNAIFNKLDRTTLVELDEVGKKQAKQILDDIGTENEDGEENGKISEFVSAFLMLFLKEAHVVPVAHKASVMLAEMGLVDPEATEGEIINFVTRQVESKDAVNTYYVLRELADAYFDEKEKKAAKERAEAEKKAAEEAVKASSKKTVKKAPASKAAEDKTEAKKPAAKKTTVKKAAADEEKPAPAKKTVKKTVKAAAAAEEDTSVKKAAPKKTTKKK